MSNQFKKAERIQSKYLWFLSDKFLGKSVTLEPRIPRRRNEVQGEDKTIKRICVSNRIKDCIQLLPLFDFSEKKYVYRVDGLAQGVSVDLPMKMVPDWDYEKGNEIWLLKPNKFTYVGMVEAMQSIGSIRWLEVADPGIPLFNSSNFISDCVTRSERVQVHIALEAGLKPTKGNNSLMGFTDATVKAYELTKHEYLGTAEWESEVKKTKEWRALCGAKENAA